MPWTWNGSMRPGVKVDTWVVIDIDNAVNYVVANHCPARNSTVRSNDSYYCSSNYSRDSDSPYCGGDRSNRPSGCTSQNTSVLSGHRGSY